MGLGALKYPLVRSGTYRHLGVDWGIGIPVTQGIKIPVRGTRGIEIPAREERYLSAPGVDWGIGYPILGALKYPLVRRGTYRHLGWIGGLDTRDSGH